MSFPLNSGMEVPNAVSMFSVVEYDFFILIFFFHFPLSLLSYISIYKNKANNISIDLFI